MLATVDREEMSEFTTVAELVPELTDEEIDLYHELLDLSEEGISEDEKHKRKTKIFVGGLKFSSEDNVLQEYFKKFGDIKEAVVIRDRRTGLSKGYGFVTMYEFKSAVAAINDKAPKLDGRRCNVNLAYIGQKKSTYIAHEKNGFYPGSPHLISPHLMNAYGMLVYPQSGFMGGPNDPLAAYGIGSPPITSAPEFVYQISPHNMYEPREPITPCMSPPLVYPSPMFFPQQIMLANSVNTSSPPLYNQPQPTHSAIGQTPPETVTSAYQTAKVFPTDNNNNPVQNPIQNPIQTPVNPVQVQTCTCLTPYTQVVDIEAPIGGHIIHHTNMRNNVTNGHVIKGGKSHVISHMRGAPLTNGMNGHVLTNGDIHMDPVKKQPGPIPIPVTAGWLEQ